MPNEQPGLAISDSTAPPAAHTAASIRAVYDYDILCTQPQHSSVGQQSTSTTSAVFPRRPAPPLRCTPQQTRHYFAVPTTSFSASAHTQSTTHTKTIHPPSRSTSKERDTESGLDYFGARYYASSMGRWMSPDWAAKAEPVPYASLMNPQSLNLYAYLLNNPLSHVDADGHACSSLSAPCPASEHQALENQAAQSPYRLAVKEDYYEQGARIVTYQVEKLDANGNLHPLGKDDPTFHVTEHQSESFGGTHPVGDHDFRSNDSVGPDGKDLPSSKYTPNKFEDSLSGGIGHPPVTSGQSFSISTSPGLNPSDSQPILVRIPGSNGPGQTGDHSVMRIDASQSGVKINGQDKLPHQN